MSSELFPPIPADTASAARSVFGRSNFYLTTGDQANNLFSGLILDDPYAWVGQSARSLAILYLITIFQFMETLPDHPAADALRVRVDWKYALHLPLNYPGLDAALFCEFRKWLLMNRTREQTLEVLLSRLSNVLEFSSRQDSFLETRRLISSVCRHSRLAKIWETMCQALEALAAKQPAWLRLVNLPHWYERYGRQRKTLNLAAGGPEQETLAQAIGADGAYLLKAISESETPGLEDLPEVGALKQVWQEQYVWANGKALWRKVACAACPLASTQRYPNEKKPLNPGGGKR